MTAQQLQLLVAATGFAGVIDVALAALAFRNRDVPAAKRFGQLCLVAGAWALVSVPYQLTTSESTAGLLYLCILVCTLAVPPLFCTFALEYAGHGEALTRTRLALLWVPATTYIGFRLTTPLHQLVPGGVRFETVNSITSPVGPQGLLFVTASVIALGYVVTGFVTLARFALDARNAYRTQTAIIFLGATVPVLGSVTYRAGVSLHPGVSMVPPFFPVFAVLTAFALFRYDFRRLEPIAGNALVDELPEPVLVVDDEGTVVSHNPAARRLTAESDLVGLHVDDIVRGLADRADTADTITVDRPGDGGMAVFETHVTEIDDQCGATCGRLFLLRDVSTQHRRMEQLQAMQAATQAFISARTAPEVAEIAVDFASDALETPLAAVFLHEEGETALTGTAMTDAFGDVFDHPTAVPDGSGPIWTAFRHSEISSSDCVSVELTAEDTPDQRLLIAPLGDHGVLVIGSDDGSYTSVEGQLGKILAGTIETALSRVAHERQLRESRTALERRTEQIEFFNGVLRHNIRNSMMVIDGHVQFLENQADGNLDKVTTIRDWCDELTVLTEKIRAITDTVTASEDERLEPVDLSTVIADEADRVGTELGAEVSVDVDDDIVVAANDLVVDVVESIVNNAVEHNDSEVPEIAVTSEHLGEWVQVKLADNGPGLSDELKTKVFQREVGTNQTSSGFGLYFVSVMMDLYEGNVWFEDNDPGGTVVVLEFRLASDRSEVPGAPAE